MMASKSLDEEFALDAGQNTRASDSELSRRCPYLSTVERKALDFDMEKICCMTLSGQHVYCCLVCGKYFRGRGKQTAAYTHSVEASHNVFMNMEDGRFFCLPDGYEILDASLDDIRFALNPNFDSSTVRSIDERSTLCTDAHGRPYLPGLIGLNNVSHTDYVTATVLALAHIKPFRDYFLVSSNTSSSSSPLVRRFAELMRRLWSPRALKAVVSPHDFLNTVSDASERKYGVGKAAEAVEFATWLLNSLHRDLQADDSGHPGGSSQAGASVAGSKRGRETQAQKGTIVTTVFGGSVEVTLLWSELEEEKAKDAESSMRRAYSEAERSGEWAACSAWCGEGAENMEPAERRARMDAAIAKAKPVFPRVTRSPFLLLSLDLPPAPLFRQADTSSEGKGGGVNIPQIPVYQLLSKFDGETVNESLRGQYRERRKYRLLSLPPYLLLAVKRFSRNSFFTERNPTIVTFPVSNLEMKPYMAGEEASATGDAPLPSMDDIPSLSIPALKALLGKVGDRKAMAQVQGGMEKGELVKIVQAAVAARAPTNSSSSKYDLSCNIVHEVQADADAVAGNAGNAVSAAAAATSSGSAVAAAAASVMSTGILTQAQEAQLASASGGAKAENQAAAAVRLAAAVSDPILRGRHKVHVRVGAASWYEVQDAHVSEALPQLIGVSDTVLMVYARR